MTQFESKTLEKAIRLYQCINPGPKLDTLAERLELAEQSKLAVTIHRLQKIKHGRAVLWNRLLVHWSLFIGSAGL